MSSVVDQGTAARVRAMGFRGDAAGKTGSSRDGWFVGYTPNLLCAVWVGFDDNRDLHLTGSESALPIWTDFMKSAMERHAGLGGTFAQPAGLVTVAIDPASGLLASPECGRSVNELFIEGTQPLAFCTHAVEDEFSESWDGPSDTEDEAVDQDESGKINLDVCAETGLLPSAECRSVRRRSFDLESLPSEVCRS